MKDRIREAVEYFKGVAIIHKNNPDYKTALAALETMQWIDTFAIPISTLNTKSIMETFIFFIDEA